MVIRITRELLNFNSVESQKPFLPNLMLRMYKILSQYPHQLKVMHIQSYLDVSDSQKFCGKQIFPNLANGTNSLFTFPKYFEYQNQSFPYENHHRTLKKTCMKIVTRATYSYRFFSYTYTLFLCCKIKKMFRLLFSSVN